MESSNDSITGTYKCLGKNTIGLFISKKVAVEVSEIIGGTVRGVSQNHLKILINFAKLDKLKLTVILFEKTHAIGFPYDELEELFVIK